MKRLLSLVCGSVMVGLALWSSAGPPEAVREPLPLALGAIQPRLAPDGKTIACSYQGAIWVLPRTGGTMTRLTADSGFDMEPAWSPDGKLLAFVRGANQPGGELRLIQADGRVVALPKPVQVRGTVNFHKLDFHPNGGRVLGVFRSAGQDHGLAWYDLVTGGVQALGVPLSPWSRHALSPDGNWIVYSTSMDKTGQQTGNDGPQTDLWKIPAAGGPPAKILCFPSRVFDLCWTATGKSLLVVSDVGGANNDLWHVPLDHPDSVKKWTTGQADEDRPSVSRDGYWLVYTDNRLGATALVVRELSTGRETMAAVDRLDFRTPTGTLRLHVQDGPAGAKTVARVVLQDERGKYFAPPGALHRMLQGTGHFYGDGLVEMKLPAGRYRMRVLRGPEYTPAARDLAIQAGQTLEVTAAPVRWAHAAKEGWFSGENHIHANYGYGQWYNTPQTMLQQCAGEDLNVCNFMVANSDTDGVFDRTFFRGRPDPLSTASTILYWNQEFRSTLWGHMTLVNLKQVVEPVFTGFHDTTNPWDIPTNADVADRTHWQQGLVNYTHAVQNPDKPFENPYAAKGLPIDVALGKTDTLDLNNAYQGTVPVWYRLLNCGFRLPGSAGTDCFLNRIFSRLPGGDRVYVQINGPLAYDRWIAGLKRGARSSAMVHCSS